MSIQKVVDPYKIIQTAGDTYQGNDLDQTYSINPDLIGFGDMITIIDQGGQNTIELVGGLSIESSIVVANEIILTLSNGAKIDVRNADKFNFNIGANLAAGQSGTVKTFIEFVEQDLGLTIPGTGTDPVEGGAVVIGEYVQSNDIAITDDTTVGVDGVVENFTYAIDSSTGQVVSQLDKNVALSGFTVGEDSLQFIDVVNGQTTTASFVNDVTIAPSSIIDLTDIIFDEDAQGESFQLTLLGIVDSNLSTIDMSVS